jgi:hypothetical protein
MTCGVCKERAASFMVLWSKVIVVCCYFCATNEARALPARKPRKSDFLRLI